MNPDQKFELRWEYRRKDDEVDSSSEDSLSNSAEGTVQKEHRIVSNLIFPQKDEESDTPRSQQNNQPAVTECLHYQTAKSTKKHLKLGKNGNAIKNKLKGNSGKKRRGRANYSQEPALLGDLKIFTKSLLEELKVARGNMFVQMKEQISELVAAKSASRTRRKRGNCLLKTDESKHQNGNESGIKTQNYYSGLKQRSMKGDVALDSCKNFKAIEERTKDKEVLEANGMDSGEPINVSNNGNQIVSSPYLSLPNILPKPQIESLRIDYSSCDQILPGCAINNANNVDRTDFLIDANNPDGYFMSIQPDEQFGRFSQISTRSVSFFDQQSTQTSSMGSGLLVPLQQLTNNCFNITSQNLLENQGQVNSTRGLRMNGGAIRFPGRSHIVSGHFVTNTISSNLNYNTGE